MKREQSEQAARTRDQQPQPTDERVPDLRDLPPSPSDEAKVRGGSVSTGGSGAEDRLTENISL